MAASRDTERRRPLMVTKWVKTGLIERVASPESEYLVVESSLIQTQYRTAEKSVSSLRAVRTRLKRTLRLVGHDLNKSSCVRIFCLHVLYANSTYSNCAAFLTLG